MERELTRIVPPVAVIVLKWPVDPTKTPTETVPVKVGVFKTGVFKVGLFMTKPPLSSPEPVCDTPTIASSEEKLLATCAVTSTMSDAVARTRLKLGDVLDT